MYYEYEQVPCVEFAFVEEGRQKPASTAWRYNGFCIDERLSAAGGGCCEHGNPWRATVPCKGYAGERVSYATAEARCAAEGKYICDHWDPRWDCGNRNL